jgi:hypothetical protein
MADPAERQLKILLKLAADTAGAQAIKAELKSIETQAASTNAAVNASGSGGIAGTQQRAQFAGVLAAEETKVTATLTQQTAIESQLQVIAATRFELAQAIANSDRAQADLLRGELGIRQATLGVMRAETLTQAELNKLSASEEVLLGKLAQNAAATAAGGLLARITEQSERRSHRPRPRARDWQRERSHHRRVPRLVRFHSHHRRHRRLRPLRDPHPPP